MTDQELMKWAFKRWNELKSKHRLQEGWEIIAKELAKRESSEITGQPLTGNSLRQKAYRIKKGHTKKLKAVELVTASENELRPTIRSILELRIDAPTKLKLIEQVLGDKIESL